MRASPTDSLSAATSATAGLASAPGDLGWRLAPLPMLLVTHDGRVLAANPAALGLLQCSESELQQQGLAMLAPAGAAWPWPAGPGASETDGVWRGPGAEPRLLRLGWSARFEQGDQALRCLSLSLPATPTGTQAERDLLHDHILDLLHDGVLLYDEDLHFLGANRSAQRILGLDEAALTGRTADTLGWRQFDEQGQPIPLQARPVWQVTPVLPSTPIGSATGRCWCRCCRC